MIFGRNIILSFVVHLVVIAAALAFAGRDAASRVPEYVRVMILSRQTGAGPDVGKEKKREPGGQSRMKVPEEIRAEAPHAAYKREDIQPYSLSGQKGHMEDEEEVKGQAASGAAKTESVAGDRQVLYGNMQVSISGDTHVEAKAKVGPAGGPDSTIAVIRAAIERAKSYPVSAKKRGIEGTVIAGFKITDGGHPEDIRIVKSSGSEILDAEARKTLLRASPFPLVKGSIEVPITFRLER